MPDPIDLITSRLGDPITISWPEHTFFCPFCIDRVGSEDRHGHLYVNEEKGYFCHRCEARGRTKWLLHTLGITAAEIKGSVPFLKAQRLREIELSLPAAHSKPPGIEPVYLPEGVDYVSANPAVFNYATKDRKLREFEIDYYGLLSWVDRGNSRLLFPDYLDGNLVYWAARAVEDYVKPKYEAAKNSEKSFCVWNLNRTRPDRPIYIAEGVMSARACGSNGVAIYGKFLSTAQLYLIGSRAGPDGVRIVFDSEAREASLSTAKKFMKAGFPCGIVRIPGEKADPDDIPDSELGDLLLDSFVMNEFDLQRLRLEWVA